LSLTVPSDLVFFDGHFDRNPILPGVVQLDWVIARARLYFAMPPAFLNVSMLKFQQVIPPGATMDLEMAWDDAKSVLHFRYVSDAGQHASGRIAFGAY
jgi:3-hydroxymyristoyl/3-hydroxydecanoyl-(acyl carrier protein) dehydratase